MSYKISRQISHKRRVSHNLCRVICRVRRLSRNVAKKKPQTPQNSIRCLYAVLGLEFIRETSDEWITYAFAPSCDSKY